MIDTAPHAISSRDSVGRGRGGAAGGRRYERDARSVVVERGLDCEDAFDLDLAVFLTVVEQGIVGERDRAFDEVRGRAHQMLVQSE